MQGSHILAYLIPDETGSTEFGRRRLNWVWYWNLPEKDLANLLTDAKGIRRAYAIPPGELHPEQEEKQRAFAESVLPPVFKSVLNATKEPFVQAIMDLACPQIVFDRTILMGMRPSSSVPSSEHIKRSRERFGTCDGTGWESGTHRIAGSLAAFGNKSGPAADELRARSRWPVTRALTRGRLMS